MTVSWSISCMFPKARKLFTILHEWSWAFFLLYCFNKIRGFPWLWRCIYPVPVLQTSAWSYFQITLFSLTHLSEDQLFFCLEQNCNSTLIILPRGQRVRWIRLCTHQLCEFLMNPFLMLVLLSGCAMDESWMKLSEFLEITLDPCSTVLTKGVVPWYNTRFSTTEAKASRAVRMLSSTIMFQRGVSHPDPVQFF